MLDNLWSVGESGVWLDTNVALNICSLHLTSSLKSGWLGAPVDGWSGSCTDEEASFGSDWFKSFEMTGKFGIKKPDCLIDVSHLQHNGWFAAKPKFNM